MKNTRFLVAVLLAAAPLGRTAAGELAPAERDALRARAREAFGKGDYEAMAEACKPLAAQAAAEFDAAAGDPVRLQALLKAPFEDALALGHACQLAGKWADAVAAYQNVVALLDLVLRAEGKAGKGEAPPAENMKAAPKAVGRIPGEWVGDRELFEQRVDLLLRIGRMQREELKDLGAAAATFAKAAGQTPSLGRSLDAVLAEQAERLGQRLKDIEAGISRGGGLPGRGFFGSLTALGELAATQEAMGQIDAAIEARNKAHANFLASGAYGGIAGLYERHMDIGAVGRLLQKLPAGQPVPRTLFVFVLSPEAPTKRLDQGDPRTLADSALPSLGQQWGRCTFVFSPPPGKELAFVTLTCDVEQLELGQGAVVSCSAKTPGPEAAVVPIGSVEWPPAKGPGRQVIPRRFEVPPGAGLLYVDVTQRKGKLSVRSVEAAGEFRARQDVVPVASAWLRAEVLPPGGLLTGNDEPIQPTAEALELEPGRYIFDYRKVGAPRHFRCEATFAPGGRYGLLANLDSPFEWQLTNLRGFGEFLASRPSLARLPDGAWLVAYGGEDRKVRLSISRDLLNWETPWLLPHEGIFETIEPTLHVDEGGTVWLAYFGNRALWRAPASGVGFRIWLTSSRDGRTWTPPRPVLPGLRNERVTTWRDYFEEIGSWPRGPIQMLRVPGGRTWMVWNVYVGSADSPGRIEELRLFPEPRGMSNPRLTCDAKGVLHMVYDSFSNSIYHRTSVDGQTWRTPIPVVQWPEAANRRLWHAQLVLDGDLAAIVYSDNSSQWWLSRGILGPPPAFSPPIKIANWLAPLNGSQAYVTPDGQVLFLAGRDTVWLLRTTLPRLTRPFQEF